MKIHQNQIWFVLNKIILYRQHLIRFVFIYKQQQICVITLDIFLLVFINTNESHVTIMSKFGFVLHNNFGFILH